MQFILGVLVGVAIMGVIARIIVIKKADGYFILDQSGAEDSQCILDLHIDQEDVSKKKWIRLRVAIKES